MDEKEKRTEEFTISAERVLDKAKELWREGSARHMVVRRQGERCLELPLTLVAVVAVLAPQFAAVGAIVALAHRCSFTVERVVEE